MDMRQLRYFLHIAETGSFSRASEILHVAQPSLSQHVRALEEELGVKLLTRHARGAAPTEFGLMLCEHARTILREVDLAKQVVRTAAESPAGEVMVGLPTSACRGITTPLADAVRSRHPNISLHIVEAMSGSLDEWIQSGRLNLALLYDHKAFDNIVTTEILKENLCLFVSPEYKHLGPEITFDQVTQLPLVLPSRQHVLRSVVEQLASRAGIQLNVAITCDSLAGIIELVKNGRATIYPTFSMLEEIRRNEMIAIPIVDPEPSWRMSIVLSKRTSNVRAAEAVAVELYQVVRKLVQEGIWNATLSTRPRAPRTAVRVHS